MNGRLQRIAQRITSLIAQVPATLGGKTAAASLSITTATDDPTLAVYGAVNESAPESDTASSGLNGRLQRVAQRITSMMAIFGTTADDKSGATDTTPVSIVSLLKQISATVQTTYAEMATAVGITAVQNAVEEYGVTDTVSVSVTTAATGTNWTNFGSQTCKKLVLINDTTVDLVWRREGETLYVPLPGANGVIGSVVINGISNTDDVEVKRADDSGTQKTLRGFVEL
jgi:hypothetical protein